MLRSLLILVVTVGTHACATIENARDSKASLEAVQVKVSYSIMVKFSSQEGLKKTLHRFQHLRMEVEEEVSASDNIYQLKLTCSGYEIDGIVHKLSDQDEIEWAKRVD
jgi:hypothetical protein